MINYFLSHKEIFEISNVCAQLKKLKMRSLKFLKDIIRK